MFRKERDFPTCRRNSRIISIRVCTKAEEHAVRERTTDIFQLTFNTVMIWSCSDWFVMKLSLMRGKIKIRASSLAGMLNILKYFLLSF